METENDKYLERLVEERSAKGDRVAANILGSLYLDRALRELDLAFLERAEEQFALAARLGHVSAAEFLEGIWPMVKLEYAEKIAKKKGEG